MKRYSAPLLSALSLSLLLAGGGLLPAGAAGAAGAATAPATKSMVVRTGSEPTYFTLSSFNVLGSTHTAAPGGMASGVARIRLAFDLIQDTSVDVVGMQELQMDQRNEFVKVAGSKFGIWPQTELTRRNVQNSIAWRTDQWELVEGHTIAIPYFDGVEWDMPYVLLRDKTTGVQAWIANFHNPATNKRHPGNAKWRKIATTREIALVNQLLADTQTSVFVTGDMNEREEYFCRMAVEAPTKAANGGSVKDGACTPPPYPMPVDWIFGAKGGGAFSNYVRDDSSRVHKITDHFVIRADVKIRPARSVG